MGKEYHRLHHHHHQYQSLHHLHSRTTFMPMLCTRTTIKDVALPKWKDHSVSVSDDTLSPKIGCMGQVRRNSRVIGFPTSHKITLTTNHNAKSNNNNDLSVKYSNLKKLFSSKNLDMMTATTTVTAVAATTAGCGRRRQVTMNCARGLKTNRGGEKCVPISIEDLDPPLPVIKKEQKPVGGEVENLWKRRSGGVALKTLQLQKIHHPKHYLQPTTVC
ncbi:uncharacterized protein LOC121257119 [Juglans microcarpa x Juglans regia]|uniref:uncharacterized protein LOC121257119 n=1 Tax=Juglans microcarpa x Juglans regia TaxID=2249226 RepID=UPI001B7EFB5A|nr:uncharacterized protein LOC121257119 [Juglans microcarpa x Juglans regia]